MTAPEYPACCVPDEAIEAVLRAVDGEDFEPLAERDADDVEEARTALAAAAPVLMAHALRHLSDELLEQRDRVRHRDSRRASGLEEAASLVRRRATLLDGAR